MNEYLVTVRFKNDNITHRMFPTYKDAAAFIQVAPALFMKKKISTLEMTLLKNL